MGWALALRVLLWLGPITSNYVPPSVSIVLHSLCYLFAVTNDLE